MIQNPLFYCTNKDTYPPFKNGLYLEEYFLHTIKTEPTPTKRTYIPVLWTNFQIEDWFRDKQSEMQTDLDIWVQEHPSPDGYFTVVQHDDGPQLKLPDNTVIYGACSGDYPIPLIYQDTRNTLLSVPKKTFSEKPILCSFVGNITSNHIQPNVRQVMVNELQSNPNFVFYHSGGWTPSVPEYLQKPFIEYTVNSKFALSPRGYGRGSFRFFECFQLGTIPVYLWNDIEWLPFQDRIDYHRLCISMHVSDIGQLESRLLSVTESDYNAMFQYYNEIKHLFELEGMSKEIINRNL
jgi:hypothetical protein